MGLIARKYIIILYTIASIIHSLLYYKVPIIIEYYIWLDNISVRNSNLSLYIFNHKTQHIILLYLSVIKSFSTQHPIHLHYLYLQYIIIRYHILNILITSKSTFFMIFQYPTRYSCNICIFNIYNLPIPYTVYSSNICILNIYNCLSLFTTCFHTFCFSIINDLLFSYTVIFLLFLFKYLSLISKADNIISNYDIICFTKIYSETNDYLYELPWLFLFFLLH